ncbi:MAG: hypothetical protein AAGF47_06630 [Planctomycetota bacterium]
MVSTIVGTAGAQQLTYDAPGPATIATRSAPLLGFDAAGRPIVGEFIDFGLSASRGTREVAYDTLIGGLIDQACTGLVIQNPVMFPQENVQRGADDFSVDIRFADAPIVSFEFAALVSNACGELPEAPDLWVVVEFYDSAVLEPVGDGADGFDTNGNGQPDSPFDPDSFLGGVVVQLRNTLQLPAGLFDVGVYRIELPPAAATMPATDIDGDGLVDGTFVVTVYETVEDTNGDGVFDLLVPFPEAKLALFADSTDFDASCFAGGERPQLGQSSDGTWGEGFLADPCKGPFGGLLPQWSDGAFSPEVDAVFDPIVDLKFFELSNDAATPLSWAVTIEAGIRPSGPRLCADVNGNGITDSADFFAWVNAFGMEPATPSSLVACDVNSDASCTSADFFAWVSFFGDPSSDPGDCAPLP